MTSLLVLTDAQVGDLIDYAEAIDVVERAFIDFGRGLASMPSKVYLDFPEFQGDLRAMPAAIGAEYAGVKLVNSHINNPARGLPVVTGTYLLFSQQTGQPICLMGATLLTAIRTGAASGVATKHLARAGACSLGLVGAGVQALHQLRSIVKVRDLATVLVWAPENDSARRNALIDRMSAEFSDLAIAQAESLAHAASADIVSTSTPSRAPLVEREFVSEGAHINAVGADGPGKQELDPAVLESALVVVDEMHQAVQGGEVNVALSGGRFRQEQIAGTLSEVILGSIQGRRTESQITLFDSTGLAIQDIAVAIPVYERARQLGVGATIDL